LPNIRSKILAPASCGVAKKCLESGMNILDIQDLRKSFGGLAVLSGISLTVAPGQVVAVIGPSGSGKSTLLRCATTLEAADSGAISYLGEALLQTENGRPVYAKKAALKKIRSCFGLVFQNFNLFPHLTALANITEAPVRADKRGWKEARADALALLDKMGLADKAEAYPHQLSGGQQQRVSIARALARRPRLLFFDEPTSALDPELTGEILRVIRGLAAEKMTMVIVTHEMSFARDVADHVIFMDGGTVVEEGPPEAVLGSPRSTRTQAFLQRVTS
jgi:polar amino acid transport system ATP-binding protein